VIGPTRTIAVLATAAIALASCSGGGSTTNVAPHAAPSSGPKAQANVTIRFTKGLHHLKKSLRSVGRRTPQFVDPNGMTLVVSSSSSTNPSFSTSTTITVAPNTDGSQTVLAPIVSSPGPSDTTFINVIEYDCNMDQLAVGQASLTSVQAGTVVQAPAITLYMVVAGIAITTDPINGGDAIGLSTDPLNPTIWVPDTTNPSFLFAFDAVGNWDFSVPVGQGGIPSAQIFTQSSDDGGTSRLATLQNGGIVLIPDVSGDGVTAHLQTYDINPTDNNYAQSTFDAYVDYGSFSDGCGNEC